MAERNEARTGKEPREAVKEPLRVLVVDDEEDTRDGCQRILSRMGYHTSTAPRGDTALQMLQERPAEIVLLDLKMPGPDGMEVLRCIRERHQETLIVVITGFATVELAIEAMKLGAYDFIAKPFDPDGLRIVVRRAEERIRLSREAERLAEERRRTLNDLGAEKSRTRTVIESLPTGVVVTNVEGRAVLVNPAFLQQVGLPADTAPGQPIKAYVKDAGLCDLVLEISRGNITHLEEIPACEFTTAGGRHLLGRGRPVVSESGECLGAAMTVADITVLRELDRLKSEFVAEVSHELRSPLSTIHEQLALVARDIAEGKSTEDLPILLRALEKTHELISLVGDLLDLSRIESGTAYREARPLRLEELLGGVVGFLKSRAETRRQSLSLELPEQPLPELKADPFALESIFGNLVSNAINYTQEGGRIRVKVSRRDGQVAVAVTDNGMGIEPGHLERIFDRFYRVKNEKTRNIRGTGLGLPIVKGLLEALGGTIKVKSTPGKGSTFTVTIPLKEAPRQGVRE